jgi:hypothetical protein
VVLFHKTTDAKHLKHLKDLYHRVKDWIMTELLFFVRDGSCGVVGVLCSSNAIDLPQVGQAGSGITFYTAEFPHQVRVEDLHSQIAPTYRTKVVIFQKGQKYGKVSNNG